MKISSAFGVVVGACRKDLLFAHGTIASIRHFSDDVSICLLWDGAPTPQLRKLAERFDVLLMTRDCVESDFLRDTFGWGFNKMTLFWEAPYDRFLYLDADTAVWGDVRSKLKAWDAYDMVIDAPQHPDTQVDINHPFFETDYFEKHFPGFPWKQYLPRYWCTGTFYAKRDALDFERYKQIRQLRAYKMGEMGMLNFLVFDAVHQKRLNLSTEPYQFIVSDHSLESLASTFVLTDKPAPLENQFAVLHWAGDKPYSTSKRARFKEPMTWFRREFHAHDLQCPHDSFRVSLGLHQQEWKRHLYRMWLKILRKHRAA